MAQKPDPKTSTHPDAEARTTAFWQASVGTFGEYKTMVKDVLVPVVDVWFEADGKKGGTKPAVPDLDAAVTHIVSNRGAVSETSTEVETTEKHLYDGLATTPTFAARNAFVQHLADTFERKAQVGKPREPECSMEALLGQAGLKLYKKALQEECKSRAFVQAVVLKSTKACDPHERFLLSVGGAGGSGKSKASDAMVDVASKRVGQSHYAIAIDGGLARETSQVRSLAIQFAQKSGVAGFEDLESRSKKTLNGMKDKLQKSVTGSSHLSVVLPYTYAPLQGHRGAVKKIHGKMEGAKAYYAQVEAPREVVKAQSEARAWDKSSVKALDAKEASIESKAPTGLGGFVGGSVGTTLFNVGKDNVYLIKNDRTFVKNDGKNWVRCNADDKDGGLFLNKRQLKAWQEDKQKDPNLDPKQWLDDLKHDPRNQALTQSKIIPMDAESKGMLAHAQQAQAQQASSGPVVDAVAHRDSVDSTFSAASYGSVSSNDEASAEFSDRSRSDSMVTATTVDDDDDREAYLFTDADVDLASVASSVGNDVEVSIEPDDDLESPGVAEDAPHRRNSV